MLRLAVLLAKGKGEYLIQRKKEQPQVSKEFYKRLSRKNQGILRNMGLFY